MKSTRKTCHMCGVDKEVGCKHPLCSHGCKVNVTSPGPCAQCVKKFYKGVDEAYSINEQMDVLNPERSSSAKNYINIIADFHDFLDKKVLEGVQR